MDGRGAAGPPPTHPTGEVARWGWLSRAPIHASSQGTVLCDSKGESRTHTHESSSASQRARSGASTRASARTSDESSASAGAVRAHRKRRRMRGHVRMWEDEGRKRYNIVSSCHVRNEFDWSAGTLAILDGWRLGSKLPMLRSGFALKALRSYVELRCRATWAFKKGTPAGER